MRVVVLLCLGISTNLPQWTTAYHMPPCRSELSPNGLNTRIPLMEKSVEKTHQKIDKPWFLVFFQKPRSHSSRYLYGSPPRSVVAYIYCIYIYIYISIYMRSLFTIQLQRPGPRTVSSRTDFGWPEAARSTWRLHRKLKADEVQGWSKTIPSSFLKSDKI